MMLMTFIRELFTPSGMTGPASEAYRRGAEAAFHSVLGAAAIALVTWLGVDVGIIDCIVVAALYSLKEFTDRRNGGSLRDCVEDTLAVFVGAILYGVAWMPIGILIVGIVIMLGHIQNGNVD